MLRSIEVDPNIVALIEDLHENVECAIVIKFKLTDWFKSGCDRDVYCHQPCSDCIGNMSWHIIRHWAKSSSWTTPSLLTSDKPMTPLSCPSSLRIYSYLLRNWDMQINLSSCKVITSLEHHIVLDDNDRQSVEGCRFMDSVVQTPENDVKRCIGLASSTFGG